MKCSNMGTKKSIVNRIFDVRQLKYQLTLILYQKGKNEKNLRFFLCNFVQSPCKFENKRNDLNYWPIVKFGIFGIVITYTHWKNPQQINLTHDRAIVTVIMVFKTFLTAFSSEKKLCQLIDWAHFISALICLL